MTVKYDRPEIIPADVLERLRASIASVDLSKRVHEVKVDPVTQDPYVVFEGYNIPIEAQKGGVKR